MFKMQLDYLVLTMTSNLGNNECLNYTRSVYKKNGIQTI